MLLDTLGASLLGNLLAGKGIARAGSGNKKEKGIVRASSGNIKGKEIVRAGYGKKWDFQCCLILSKTLKYKSIMKMNQDLLEFSQEIICLKK